MADDALDKELEIIRSSLLPSESVAVEGTWSRVIAITSSDSAYGLRISVGERYPDAEAVKIDVKGRDDGREEAEEWARWSRDKMVDWDTEDGVPLYQLLTTHFMPLLVPVSRESSPVPTAAPAVISSGPHHALLTSHHLLSPTKRRDFAALSSQLSLTGFSKVGHPGIYYAIGARADLDEWVREIKSWNWLALRVRVAIEPLVVMARPGTPPLVRRRIYEQVVAEVAEESVFKHVPYTEQLVWQTLQQVQKINLHKHPTTFGAADDDPAFFLRHIPKDYKPSLDIQSSIDEAAKQVIKRAVDVSKSAKNGLQKVLACEGNDPIDRLHEFYESVLSASAIRETIRHSPDKADIPHALRDLVVGRHSCLAVIDNETLHVPELDRHVLIQLKYDLSTDLGQQAKAFIRGIGATLASIAKPSPLDQHRVWGLWEEAQQQRQRDEIVEMELPLETVKHATCASDDFDMPYIAWLVQNATPINRPKAVTFGDSAADFFASTWQGLQAAMEDNPYAISLLDEFDGRPFPDISSSTRPSEVSAEVRAAPIKRLDVLDRLHQPTWLEELGEMDEPLMPWRHSDASLPRQAMFPPILPTISPPSSPPYHPAENGDFDSGALLRQLDPRHEAMYEYGTASPAYMLDERLDVPGAGPMHVPRLPEQPAAIRKSPLSYAVTAGTSEPGRGWVEHSAIKNPAWFAEVCKDTRDDRPLSILAKVDLGRQRELLHGLRQAGFDLIDRLESIQGTDLVLSPSVAILFRRIADIPAIRTTLIEEAKMAAAYFAHVLIVIETSPYAAFGRSPNPALASINPLSSTVLKEIATLRRALELSVASSDMSLGKPELVFAYDGADEVGRILRAYTDRQFAAMKGDRDDETVQRACDQRQWLGPMDVKMDDNMRSDEQQLIHDFGINSFAALYLLNEFETLSAFAFDMDDEQRLEAVGAVLGRNVVERFNRLLLERIRLEREKADSAGHGSDHADTDPYSVQPDGLSTIVEEEYSSLHQMRAVVLGASRGVGHAALVLLLARGWDATVLLRSAFPADAHAALEPYMRQLTVVVGDATEVGDVRRLFAREVDVVVSSIGGTGTFTLTRGAVLSDPSVCARAALALVCALAELAVAPRVVAVSSMGIGDSHGTMPLAMRIFYPLAIKRPHDDKLGLEHVLSTSSISLPPSPAPPPHILSPAQLGRVPRARLPGVTIVRPAFFVDGAPRGPERTRVGEQLSAYTVARGDVARFIVDECVGGDKWVNKRPIVGH
ncbi:hypothetical protein Q5752_002387 [Cryptotrichosporon argae]